MAQVTYEGPLPPNILNKLSAQDITTLVNAYADTQKNQLAMVELVVEGDDRRKTKKEAFIVAIVSIVVGGTITGLGMHYGVIKDLQQIILTLLGIPAGLYGGKSIIDLIRNRKKKK